MRVYYPIVKCRLIPAHAGKTSSTGSHDAPPWAHPRSRGENALSPRFPVSTPGSSPLTRGKPQPHQEVGNGGGLIPAHAGKTSACTAWVRSGRAHPRSRGENAQTAPVISRLGGSSPLTRGKPRVDLRGVKDGGLIPAHAGKTSYRLRSGGRRGAHPRSRGENAVSRVVAFFERGSSPLTRGKLSDGARHVVHAGLIPAHAGKTRAGLCCP